MAAEAKIVVEENGAISFGDYRLEQKAKLEDFPYKGDFLKVKTYKDITKLEKNGLFVYESVPGTAVSHFVETENGMIFTVAADEDVQITVGLDEDTEYRVYVDNASIGNMTTGLGGKLSLSVELEKADKADVRIERM